MTKLEQLIEELCPDGVEFCPLEQCCNILDRKRKPVTKSAREAGDYPYYGANGIQDYVSDYIFDGTFILVGEDGSVITDRGTPVVTWASGKIWVNNHAHIIEESGDVLLRYLYHYIQTIDVSPLIHGNIPKLTGGDFKALQIPVPPLPVQREIVRILDNFTELAAELTAELTARKQQYAYYRNKLLKKNTKAIKMEFGDMFNFQNGFAFKSRLFKKSGNAILRIANIKENQISTDNLAFFDEADYKEDLSQYIVRQSDIVIAMSGATTGKIGVNVTSFNFYLNQRVGKFIPNENIILNRYLYHLLLQMSGEIYAISEGGAQPNLSSEKLKKLTAYIPPISEQKRIVKVLDRFDTLCTDLSSGLPAEIEARQKQYEYYRDKLLTFGERFN